MFLAWVLMLLLLAIAAYSLILFQNSPSTSSRIITGAAAMIAGVSGLVLLVTLIFG